MRQAVQLAQEAKSRYLVEHPFVHSEDIKIALSLGPYGATQSTHEFDGIYPPPYGPREYDPSDPDGNTNYFARREDELQAITALRKFHWERLAVFAEDSETWNCIDYIAFETVPLCREIRAIRGAMEQLVWQGKKKPWWISTVYPNGQFPEHTGCGDGTVPIADVVRACLSDQMGGVVPDGLGVNCTTVDHLPSILEQLVCHAQLHVSEAGLKPWLVVYPNGGDWDHSTGTWSNAPLHTRGVSDCEIWARRLRDAVGPAFESMIWRGLILGGCCKTGPQEIAALSGQRAGV